MPVSRFRTVRLDSGRRSYGVVLRAPTHRWPTALPDDDLDYGADATTILADVEDTIFSAEISIKPSGSGELTVSQFYVSGALIVAWLTGGIPGRDYLAKIEAQTQGGRNFERFVKLLIDPRLAATPLPPPPVDDFGASMTWPIEIGLEDGSGGWLFSDGSTIGWS